MAKTVLVLRSCSANMTSYNNFKWPESGPVSCPDWRPTAECGNGLHGFLWGEGNGDLANWSPDARWLVVEVDADKIIDLDGKIKFPNGCVVHCGDHLSATTFIATNGAIGRAIIGVTATAGSSGTAIAGYSGTAIAGNRGTATAGDNGTATAGSSGTAIAGDNGTAIAGNRGTATAGDNGTATAGSRGTATAGDNGTATAGDNGTATAGYSGTAIAGNRGTATAGDNGTATAGDRGTATAGDNGTATAGDSGILAIRFYDILTNRYRLATGYIGENGILPNRKYRLNDQHEFELVSP